MSAQPSHLSLLKLLTLPFLAVIVLLGAVAGVLAYRTSALLADEVARQWLGLSVQRVADTLERRRAEADAVLRAAFPDGDVAAGDPAAALEGLVPRMWTALLLQPQPGVHLRFVSTAGQVIALRRLSGANAELTLQRAPGARFEGRVFAVAGTSLPRAAATGLEERADPPGDPADARELAWVRRALSSESPVWLPPEADPAAQELAQWRARRVLDGEGRVAGVAGAEVTLKAVNDLLRDMSLPPRAVALVVDTAGQLVALRGAPVLRSDPEGRLQRLSVREGVSPAAADWMSRLTPRLAAGASGPSFVELESPDGQPMLASLVRFGEASGQPWAVIAAAPRGDFSAAPLALLARIAAAALVAVAVVLVLGAWVRRRIVRDARELANLAGRIGDGDLDTPPGPMATHELHELRDSLRRMQLRLRTDRVTGLANRESVLSRLHDRMRPGRRRNDAPLLALLFVDLDRFRAVNDRHGHDVGDFALRTIGRRLRQTVRDTDLVARWSGDEFLLLLDGVGTPEHAQRVRDQVERVLRDPVELGPGRDAVELDGTVGLALSPGDAQEPEALIRAAENDMVQRKPSSLSQW